ncbi:MAG: M48 family peptidase, partial [Candidatus Omnitrophica bacterium]|nr:M48 family peptidase [Candidatus Omnitrophota bacterium]
MNIYLVIILFVLIGEYLLESAVEFLNVKHASSDLPGEFTDFYDAGKYSLSQRYLKETAIFHIAKDTVFLSVTLLFILSGFFNVIDGLARGLNAGYILTALVFGGVLLLITHLFNIPFSAYRTFYIEQKYGFNRTT